MRVTIERNGRREEVDVAPDLSSVTLAGRTFPVSIVATAPTRVELEVGGERVVVDQWPEHFPEPPGPVDVAGERWKVRITTGPAGPVGASPSLRPRPAAPVAPSASAPAPDEGIAIVPPMPGRVVEVRVHDGERVEKGAVLLVLEAMKMRNEVTSPVAGTVRGLRVQPGSNARAKEAMVFVVPTGTT